MPKILKTFFLSLAVTLFFPIAVYGVYLPVQGGTGYGTTVSSNIGKALIVSSTSPFLYTFGDTGKGSTTSSPFNPCAYWSADASNTAFASQCLTQAKMVPFTNLAINGNFNNWTAGLPDNWFFSALSFGGDGSGSVAIFQQTTFCSGGPCIEEDTISSDDGSFVIGALSQGIPYDPTTVYSGSFDYQTSWSNGSNISCGLFTNFPLTTSTLTTPDPGQKIWNVSSNIWETFTGLGGNIQDGFVCGDNSNTSPQHVAWPSMGVTGSMGTSTLYFGLFNATGDNTSMAYQTYFYNVQFGTGGMSGHNAFTVTLPTDTPFVVNATGTFAGDLNVGGSNNVTGTLNVGGNSTLNALAVNGVAQFNNTINAQDINATTVMAPTGTFNHLQVFNNFNLSYCTETGDILFSDSSGNIFCELAPQDFTTTTINGFADTVFNIQGDSSTIATNVTGNSTTFSLINSGDWAGTWAGNSTSFFYPASNPAGYITTTTIPANIAYLPNDQTFTGTNTFSTNTIFQSTATVGTTSPFVQNSSAALLTVDASSSPYAVYFGGTNNDLNSGVLQVYNAQNGSALYVQGRSDLKGNLSVVGSSSFGDGSNATPGQFCSAFGQGADCEGLDSVAFSGSIARNTGSIALPGSNQANGDFSLSGGIGSQSGGYTGFSYGEDNSTPGEAGVTIGGIGDIAGGLADYALGVSMHDTGDYDFGINVSSTIQTINGSNIIGLLGGNVGVGTTTPQKALDVQGEIRSSATSTASCFTTDGINCLGSQTLTATTASLGGSLLTIGNCSTNTTTVSGATVGMVCTATPSTYPGDPSDWSCYISASNVVTTRVCALATITPTASVYNIRVIR